MCLKCGQRGMRKWWVLKGKIGLSCQAKNLENSPNFCLAAAPKEPQGIEENIDEIKIHIEGKYHRVARFGLV